MYCLGGEKVSRSGFRAYLTRMKPDHLRYLEKIVQRTGCKSVYLWEKRGCRETVREGT